MQNWSLSPEGLMQICLISEKTSDKRAGISGSLNYSGIKGLEIAAVAGVDYVLSENLGITPPTAYSELTSGADER